MGVSELLGITSKMAVRSGGGGGWGGGGAKRGGEVGCDELVRSNITTFQVISRF